MSGKALTLINYLESDKQTYNDVKILLEKAVAPPETHIFKTINQISKLQLSCKSEPFKYISKVRLLVTSVNKLQITSEHFLQYSIWEGLNTNFKLLIEQITNSNRPTLSVILDKYFEACERYEPGDVNNEKVSSTGYAIDVKHTKFLPCCIFSHLENNLADHLIFKCSKFVTNQSKITKLKNMKACICCSGLQFSCDCIDSIDFIIGAKSNYCLPEN